MSIKADNLRSAVRYALETTRATTVCPFHPDVMIRVGDDAAENHAYARARKIIKSDGTMWEREVLMEGLSADSPMPQMVSVLSVLHIRRYPARECVTALWLANIEVSRKVLSSLSL
ncbi:hypothetical protein [Bradyrhizobium sp.]|uniref:hypothetical protein n=1 Tax=Bradyrhizobium sp. TaxID=376 RepID=UPI003BB10E5B